MKLLLAVTAAALILSLTLSWTFRHHIVVGNDPLTVYSIDRWTGEVSLIAPEPAMQALTSQSLRFVRSPLVRLREPSYGEQLMKTFSVDDAARKAPSGADQDKQESP